MPTKTLIRSTCNNDIYLATSHRVEPLGRIMIRNLRHIFMVERRRSELNLGNLHTDCTQRFFCHTTNYYNSQWKIITSLETELDGFIAKYTAMKVKVPLCTRNLVTCFNPEICRILLYIWLALHQKKFYSFRRIFRSLNTLSADHNPNFTIKYSKTITRNQICNNFTSFF